MPWVAVCLSSYVLHAVNQAVSNFSLARLETQSQVLLNCMHAQRAYHLIKKQLQSLIVEDAEVRTYRRGPMAIFSNKCMLSPEKRLGGLMISVKEITALLGITGTTTLLFNEETMLKYADQVSLMHMG